MSVSTDKKIAAAYVAFYQRAPDQDGLNFWRAEAAQNGYTDLELMKKLAAGFSQHPSFADAYGGLTDEQFIDAIYVNVGGAPADVGGKAYWLAELQGGMSRSDFVASFTYGLLELSKDDLGAMLAAGEITQQEYDNAVLRSDRLQNKTDVALNFTEAMGEQSNLAGYTDPMDPASLAHDRAYQASVAALAGVTEDPASMDQVNGMLQRSPSIEDLLNELGEDAGAANVFTLKHAMSEGTAGTAPVTAVYWGYKPSGGNNPDFDPGEGIPVSELLAFVTSITGLDLHELGLIDDDGAGPFDNVTNLELTFGGTDVDGNGNDVLTIFFADGTSFNTEAVLGTEYFDFLNNLLFDAEGNSRLFEKVIVPGSPGNSGGEIPIVLTPNQNNGGTVEPSHLRTTAGDDTIVAGHLDLLHQAYIDAGGGYNILEVDTKGVFAQPLQLLNIQEVRVNNLPNVYEHNGYPEWEDDSQGSHQHNPDSILDLSRATSIERLVITEGSFDGINGNAGDLTIAGIRNGATARFEGAFSNDVTLHYGQGLTGPLTVELLIGQITGDLNFAHNTDALHLVSLGGVANSFGTEDLGGRLTHLQISGDAALYINGDLDRSFQDDTPVTIDASENTGGVDLELSGSENVTFIGSQGNDSFEVDAEVVTIEAGEGNNTLDVDAEVVTITTGDGNNTIEANGAETVSITTGAGDDAITALRADSVTIDAGEGDNEITVSGATIAVTTGEGNDTITVSGFDLGNSGLGDGNLAATININTGAGEDTVVLGRDEFFGIIEVGLTALPGSSITGENITLAVENPSDLRAAQLEGISKVVLNYDQSNFNGDHYDVLPILTITAEQFADIGAENFDVYGAAFSNYAQIKILITEDVSLTDLGVDSLPGGVDLVLEIYNGAEVEMTAEQLHTRIAPDGVTLADNNNTDVRTGSVLITNAGANFDPFNTSDTARTIIDGKTYYGGSLSDDFMDGGQYYNVRVDASPAGYDRPFDVPALTRFTLDTDVQSEYGAFSTWHTYLRIIGDEDFVFSTTEEGIDDWGVYIPGGSAIELGKDLTGNQEFVLDFSKLNGELINLAVARFEDAEQVWGNGTTENPARLNVELTGDVGGPNDGLFSRDVQVYVVTALDTADGSPATWEFWTSRPTEDLETLGLRGNYGDTIIFQNTERGVDFLLEVAYDKTDGYAVGNVEANYARGNGATAVFNVVNIDAPLPAGEQQVVESITTNATAVEINIEGGNTVIEALAGADHNITTLALTADADLTIGDLDGLANGADIDASAVTGELALSFDPEADFNFTGAEGGSTITFTGDFEADNGALDGTTTTIDGGAAGVQLVIAEEVKVNLSAATLSNVNGVTLQDDSTLSLTLDQADTIGAGNFQLALGSISANLELTGLAEQEFAIAQYAQGITVTVLELADLPEITLHPNTDLSGIGSLKVHEGTVLNLTAAQFQQLGGNGTIEGVNGNNFTVNITDLTQADVEGGFDLSGITAANVTVTLAEDVELAASDTFADATVEIGGFTLTLATLAQADGLNVNGDAGSVLKLLATTATLFTSIDASGFNIDELQFLNVLAANTNVDLLFFGLPERVEKVIYTGLGWVDGVTQNVTIEAGTTVPGWLAFNKPEDDVEIRLFNLNLEGGTEITGNLHLSTTEKEDGAGNDLIKALLQQVTINSTGSAENLLTGKTANIIDGNIDPMATPFAVDNNLLNVVINADQALEITGSIIFSSVVNDDDITANDDYEAEAVLTVNGTADVSLGTLDTSDDEVDSLVVTNSGTGTVSAILNAGAIDAEDALSFLGSNIELTIVGNVDLSDDVITGVSEITLTDAATTVLTLAQEQFNDLGAANLVTANTIAPFPTLHLVEFDGAVVFDATTVHAGINVGTITLIEGAVTLDPSTNLTGVDQIIVPEGGSLDLTAAQYQQLFGTGTIVGVDSDGNPTSNFTVNITDLTQADVDAGFNITGITADNITLSLAEDVNLVGTGPNITNLGDLGDLTVILSAGQVLGLGNVTQADGLVVDGPAATLVYQFVNLIGFPGQIDASGYDVAVLKALAASFTTAAASNIEYSIDDLRSSVELRLYQDPEELGFLAPTHRVVVIEEGITTPIGLIFNDWDSDDEVRTLHLTLEGDVVLNGDLSIPTRTDKEGDLIQRYFDTLTIVSEGDDANTIAGNINTGASFGATTANNNLLNIVIDAQQDLVITGEIEFNSIDVPLDNAVATLTVNGPANVTIKSLDATDVDISTLNVVHNGTGLLTITGGSDALELDNTETLVFTGTGDILLDTHNGAGNNGVEGDDLSVIDASGLSGDLSLGVIEDIDSQNFVFTSGTGVTSLTLAVDTLNANVAADPADTGWTFDFTNAAVGSAFHIGDGVGGAIAPTFALGPLNILLGANTTLYINEGVGVGNVLDLTKIDLNIVQNLPIVLADGVTLLLTAEQASGLNIIGANGAASTGVVNIIDLANDQVYDFSGIAEDVAGTITLAENDVTVEPATDLGYFSITLDSLVDNNFSLDGQTIRFNTVEQAERDVIVINDNSPAPGNSTNVVWLFENITGPVDTSGYFQLTGPDAYAIGRLFVTEELINNYGGDIEQLFTTLPASILRVDFSDLTALEVLLSSVGVDRQVEMVHFTTLGDVTFSDLGIDPVEHVESLELHLGGEVNIGNILLDDDIGVPGYDPTSVVFDSLTIWSQLAIHDSHLLASEHFLNDNDGVAELGEHVQPDHQVGNTIGNISVGSGLDLLTVTLNTLTVPTYDDGSIGYLYGSELNIGTLTYGARSAPLTPSPANPVLNVTGANDINIASVVATDPDLGAMVTVNAAGFTGVLSAPGTSPAFVLGDQIETLVFTGGGASGGATINLGSDDPGNPNAGVSGAGLSLIDASGYNGVLNLGILSLIDGDGTDDTLNIAFELRTGNGITKATLDQDPDSSDVPTLAAGSEWKFDYTNAAAGSRLTITDAVVFEAHAKLTLKNVDLYIVGDVDLTDVDLYGVDGDSSIFVEAGNTLALTYAQVQVLDAKGVDVQGEGTTLIVDEVNTGAAVSLDLTGIQTVGIDLSGLTNAGTTVPQVNDVVVTLDPAGALNDANQPVGFNFVGSDFNDNVTGSNLNDTLDGGAGDDTLTGGDGDDTFLVTAGEDIITDLLANGTEDDVLVVSAGATATANGVVAFTATADTVNNGTANLNTDAAGGTIDVSKAGGTNGFNLTGGDGFDTLTGSDQGDVINGGNNGATSDKLTGGLGADTFFFNINQNNPTDPTITVITQGVDEELLTVTGDGVDDDNEVITVTYTLNGIAAAVVLDTNPAGNYPGLDVTDANAVATALAALLNGVAGITATSAAAVVTASADNGGSLSLATSVTGGTETLAVLPGGGADVAHEVDVVIPPGTALGGNYVVGDIIKVAVTLAGGAVWGTEYVVNATHGLTPADVAEGLSNQLNALGFPASTVGATFSGDTITLKDEVEDNGGFTVAITMVGGISSTGASALGAPTDATLDIITDFVSGTDKVSFEGMQGAVQGINYLEGATVEASYAAALASAETALNGTVTYYFTAYNDGVDPDDHGLLFFDANGDGDVDGAVKLLGVLADDFAAGDIAAGV